MVTGGRILLSCFLGLCDTKDINFMILPLKFLVLLFSHGRVMGSHIFALINRFGGLKMRCS